MTLLEVGSCMQKGIKSFVLRAGRVSNRQQKALDLWLPQYQIHLENAIWDMASLFPSEAPTVVEIGFGMGASLCTMAMQAPHINFLGIEVHKAGVGSLVAALHEHALSNVRIVVADAVEVLTHYIPLNTLHGVQIFFPDPWHKKKHNKRRLIQPSFVNTLVDRLSPSGFIHCVTDWDDYAAHMLAVFSQHEALKNIQEQDFSSLRPTTRSLTKFEARAAKLGHKVHDLIFIKH